MGEWEQMGVISTDEKKKQLLQAHQVEVLYFDNLETPLTTNM